MTYLSGGGKVGDKIQATASCDKSTITSMPLVRIEHTHLDAVGKTLAYTSVIFKNAKGEIAARGSHTKYVHPFSIYQVRSGLY